MSTLQPGPVAVVGVGNMGGGMASRLLGQGWAVQVCDLDASKTEALAQQGAQVLARPAQVQGCAATLVVVVDTPQVEAVLFGPGGLLEAVKPGHTVFLCPTIAPDDVASFAARLAVRGIHTVDAPMSGGPVRARDGGMSLLLAAPAAVLQAQQALLSALSNQCLVISERPGDGARTKLVNNLLAGINLVGAAEALALAERLGLDAARTLDVIERSSGQSWIGSDRLRRALAGDYAPRAHVTLLEKDTGLAVAAARSVGFEGPLGERASRVFAQAHQAGMAELDDAAIFRHLQNLP